MPHQIFKTCENIYEILYPCQYETAGKFGKIDQIKWCNRKQKRIKVFARVLAHLEN